ncbi:hypothetical protein [Sphingomonas sp.]|jgi:hypothetical protein|uniref:hypothetical protein n=1 Tax=Sphingomonas sp. TaxID=28214 RepID=UPI002E37AC7B|nr:hypothetical protein [Sphingomonas sp.]HEX4695794.1 hypothetical protein [Sphingomonas sp.]
MTGISTALSTLPFPLAPDRSSPGVPDAGAGGPSFADMLASVLDRALTGGDGGSDDRLPGSTMRSSVEMFDQHGFFAGVAPPVPGTADAPDRPRLVSDLPRSQPVSSPIQLPITAISPSGAAAVTEQETSSIASAALPERSAAESASAAPAVVAARSEPGAIEATAVPVPLAVSRGRLPGSPKPTLPAAGRTAPNRPASEAASRVKVAIDRTDAGVAVSVTADAGATIDHGAVHEAVAQMLARHGLVLSELRVNRRGGPDAQGKG